MAGMTRDTRGIRIGCAGFVLLGMGMVTGCAQSGQANARPKRFVPGTPVARAAAPAAPASPLASPFLATAQAAGNVVNAAAGAVTGAIKGAVGGAGGTPATATTPQKKVPRIKPDGRGGYDASELQADAIARAHAMTARYGITGYSKITGRPTPSTQPSGN